VVSIFITSCNWWKEIWGDHPLGNNLSLLDGDKKEDRVIVYCSGKSAGTCDGGIFVVPTYERHFDGSGKYVEYVEMAQSNKEWVIVKTHRTKEKKDNYWFISKKFIIEDTDCTKFNCDSILQSHVMGPFDHSQFIEKRHSLKIELSFE
jgi:hypothetical protein